MLQKLSCHMAIIQNSGSKSTSVCIWTKSYIYVSPLYIYSSYPPFRCHCQCLQRSLAFFSDCSCMWVINGGSWCLTNSDPDWVLFKHHLLTIKLLARQRWVTDLVLFTHWCLTRGLAGGKRWVDNNLALVLFKHHCLNRFLLPCQRRCATSGSIN